MDTLIAKCDTEHIVLQVDFSENATIASQHEIAHWSHVQATLFTGLCMDQERPSCVASENKCESYVLISDELSLTKHSVYVFMDYIFKQLTEKFPAIKKTSDGASQQFKQRFLFSNLHIWGRILLKLCVEFLCDIPWQEAQSRGQFGGMCEVGKLILLLPRNML